MKDNDVPPPQVSSTRSPLAKAQPASSNLEAASIDAIALLSDPATADLAPPSRRPRIVLAPMNFANMPMQIVQALRRHDYTVAHVQYTTGHGHKFGYNLDNEINVRSFDSRVRAHGDTLRRYLDEDFDIFHFWNKTLFYNTNYGDNTGFDLPLIKSRQKKIIHRFSGFDLRLRAWDLERNPYSPFRHGYEFPADERLQIAFLDFLRDYADQLLVQDPELGQFVPEARIIPRALDLRDWPFVGIGPTARPLVIHTPTNPEVKGTAFVLKAVETLQAEGLAFDFQLVQNVSHDEARAWMRRADIVVDQLLIGATGVVTLEAWALGKPVVLYLREDLFRPFYGTADLPVANANPDTIEVVLRNLVKDFDWRQHLTLAGRRTVEAHHDIEKVIGQFIELYETIHRAPPRIPTGTADIDYLMLQTEASVAPGRVLARVEDVLKENELLSPEWKPPSAVHVDLPQRLRLLKLELRRQVKRLRDSNTPESLSHASASMLSRVEEILQDNQLLGTEWKPPVSINDLPKRLRLLKIEVRRQVRALNRRASDESTSPNRPARIEPKGWRKLRRRLGKLLARLTGNPPR